MKQATWSEKYGCYECSFCEEPQGSLTVMSDEGVIRYCTKHQNALHNNDGNTKDIQPS